MPRHATSRRYDDDPRTPRRGRSGLAVAVTFVAALLLACVLIGLAYAVEDYTTVRETARTAQQVLVVVLWAAAAGAVVGVGALAGYAVLGLIGGWHRWASPAARASEEAIALKEADHIALPGSLTSYNAPFYDQRKLPAELPAPAPAELPAPAPDPTPTGPLLPGLVARGLIAPTTLFVGLSEAGPAQIDMQACGFVAVGGRSRSGKSTTTKSLIAQAVLHDWHVAICDPFPQKHDGLMALCEPLSGRLWRQAGTPEEIAATILLVDKIGRRRLDGDPADRPVLLVIEEFSNIVIRQMLPAHVLNLLPAMAMAYAAVGVHGVIIGHDWSRKLLGDEYGATLRRACTHRIVHRMAPDAAGMLVPTPAHARQVAEIKAGRALFWGDDTPELLSIPMLSPQDLSYAARGMAPSAYRPRPARAAVVAGPPPAPVVTPPTAAPSRLAPTEPISATPAPRAAPPTARLPEPTHAEIIALALDAAPHGLTAAELADQLGIDLAVVKTRLAELKGDGIVNARPGSSRAFVYTLIRRPPTA